MGLNHAHIAKLVDFKVGSAMTRPGKPNKIVSYMVIEYCPGGTLFDYLCEMGQFDDKLCRYYFRQMLEALDYMHSRGVAHRDLKPENLLLDKDLNLKISDFGLATNA